MLARKRVPVASRLVGTRAMAVAEAMAEMESVYVGDTEYSDLKDPWLPSSG
jgi:hypothetical protein